MKRFILAFQFLTVFPISSSAEVGAGDLAGSMAYYPLVGAFQGALLTGAYALFSVFFPVSITAALVITLLALTNGGLHLDGFADTVDGLAGGGSPEERMRIMRDSSTGAIGAVFVVLVLLLKYLAVSELPHDVRLQAVFLFPVAGRWAMVPMACWAPYARKEGGLGESFAANSYSTLIVSTLVIAALMVYFLGPLSLVILAALGVLVFLLTVFFKKKIGGVTGDVFGFQSEVAEVFFLLAVIAAASVISSRA